MCIASSRVSAFKLSDDKDRCIDRIKRESTFKIVGDDIFRYFTDGSIAVHRTIVNELQLFKAV